jgi:hypothetical protein
MVWNSRFMMGAYVKSICAAIMPRAPTMARRLVNRPMEKREWLSERQLNRYAVSTITMTFTTAVRASCSVSPEMFNSWK